MDDTQPNDEWMEEETNPPSDTPLDVVVHVDEKETSLQQAKAEISDLHAEAMASCRTTITKALAIGAKLTEVKRLLRHGQWCKWVDVNLEFDVRTAQNYMRLHHNRDLVLAKYAKISHLGVTDTYHALAKFPKKPTNSQPPPPATEQGDPQGEEQANSTESLEEVSQAHNSSESGTTSEEELFVGAFSPQQVEQVLEFLRGMGANREAYQILRANGEIRKLTPTLQAKIMPYLNPFDHEDGQELL